MNLRGDELPAIVTSPPGPTSLSWLERLSRHECPAITARRTRRAAQLDASHDDPVVWNEAKGAPFASFHTTGSSWEASSWAARRVRRAVMAGHS